MQMQAQSQVAEQANDVEEPWKHIFFPPKSRGKVGGALQRHQMISKCPRAAPLPAPPRCARAGSRTPVAHRGSEPVHLPATQARH
jgi:hypothetical protein